VRERLQFLGRLAAVNALIAAGIAIAFAEVGLHTPWRRALEEFAVTFCFCICISSLCLAVLPRVIPPVFKRFGAPLNWLIAIVVMFLLAAGGSLFVLAVMAAVGYIQPADILVNWLNSSLKVSVIVTLTLGVFMTAREMLRGRLNRAMVALRTKERDEADARRAAAEAQLASLESRVQPHFLFNTLNSIAALIPKDPGGAERMTGQLASLLRSALDAGPEPLVRLDQELQVVRDYLEIECVRFGDRLKFRFEIDESVTSRMIPKLSLQTLVENSIKYAVAPRRDGGTIVVRAGDTRGCLRIAVSDDGPGFETQSPAGHGLALLRDRLHLMLGDRGRLTIDSRSGDTTVAIEIGA
jgi:two-component system, LytTR family, sensor histidine kinase AlgZ